MFSRHQGLRLVQEAGPDIEPLPLLITGVKLRTAVSTERLYTSVTALCHLYVLNRDPRDDEVHGVTDSDRSIWSASNLLAIGAMAGHHHIRINLRSDLY